MLVRSRIGRGMGVKASASPPNMQLWTTPVNWISLTRSRLQCCRQRLRSQKSRQVKNQSWDSWETQIRWCRLSLVQSSTWTPTIKKSHFKNSKRYSMVIKKVRKKKCSRRRRKNKISLNHSSSSSWLSHARADLIRRIDRLLRLVLMRITPRNQIRLLLHSE